MERYTKKIDGKFVVDLKNIESTNNGYVGDAINKLGEFESIIEEIVSKQEELSKELAVLRDNGESKSYKFRELLGHKLINSALITIFESHKLM